ncbi:MAG TPA: N-acetylmuramoyl-L-alanine amidase [Coriobacteriia bacterium]
MRSDTSTVTGRQARASERRPLVAVAAVAAVLMMGAAFLSPGPLNGAGLVPTVKAAIAAPVAGSAVATPSVEATPSADATPLVVVIDAGHQAHANLHLEPIGPGSTTKKYKVAGGTTGRVTHVHESLINLRVALRLRTVLRAAGVTVIMIRTTQNVNIPNSKRAQIANAAHADLTVRIHCDGTARSIHGILTLVPKRNRWTGPIVVSSLRAGRAIQSALLLATGASDRGITPRGDMSGFNWSGVPSVIVEMGNMKNAKEDRLLSTVAYERKLAYGIAQGVLAYAAAR